MSREQLGYLLRLVKGGMLERATTIIEQELAKPEQEPLANEKEGSPCPEFWDWLPKAYNFAGNGVFTKYNMEVAFLAGKQFSSTAPPRTSIEHAVIAGVLYDFMGWLTSRRARLCLSDKDNASPAVDAIVDFAKMRGLNLEDAQVERWQAILTTPHSAKGSTDSAESFGKRKWVGLKEDEVENLMNATGIFGGLTPDEIALARAIEAKLKEKNT